MVLLTTSGCFAPPAKKVAVKKTIPQPPVETVVIEEIPSQLTPFEQEIHKIIMQIVPELNKTSYADQINAKKNIDNVGGQFLTAAQKIEKKEREKHKAFEDLLNFLRSKSIIQLGLTYELKPKFLKAIEQLHPLTKAYVMNNLNEQKQIEYGLKEATKKAVKNKK